MIKKSTLTLQVLKVERKYVIAFGLMVTLHYIFRVIKMKLFKFCFLKPYETYMNTKSTFVETLHMYFKLILEISLS